jgi:hypothetical protein
MKTTISILLGVALAGPMIAQTFTQTLPRGFDTVDGNYAIGTFSGVPTLFNSIGTSVWQYTYDWSTFVHRVPLTISQLALRRSSDATLPGGTYSQVQITMASSQFNHPTTSSSLANNLDPNDTVVVYNGPITIPPYTTTAAIPAPWLITLPLVNLFEFDPSRQRDLVIEIRVLGTAPVGSGLFILDGTFPNAFVGQRGHRSNGLATVSDWANGDAGLVCQIQYSLGNSSDMDLQLVTSGGGVGDLFYQVSNLPVGTVEGYTLISLVPTSTFAVPFGEGPLLGIWPDSVTFLILSSPAALGDPFHWISPAGGFFPDSPIAVGPGTLTQFAGLTFECSAVALDATRAIIGVSPPRAVNW